MRQLIVFLYASMIACSLQAEPNDHLTFESTAAVRVWAEKTSFGGNSVRELRHKEKRLLVVIRDQASGVHSSEPFVFLNKKGGWVKVFQATACPCALHGFVRNGFLLLEGTNKANGEDITLEYAKFNLEIIP